MKLPPRKPPTVRAIEAIYAKVPRLECRRLCQEACGPILMSRPEWDRIINRLGYEPKGDDSLVCPMLCRETGRCRVYDVRPLICRIWACVESMRCPHGCEPSRWLTDDEAHALIAEMERVGRGSPD